MPFPSEDKVIIKHYRLGKGYGKRKFLTMFPNHGCTLSGLRNLIKKKTQFKRSNSNFFFIRLIRIRRISVNYFFFLFQCICILLKALARNSFLSFLRTKLINTTAKEV